MVVVAAVAFLAVVQQQLRQAHSDGFEDETVQVANGSFNGLVGLSLTYALPIVGELGEHSAAVESFASRACCVCRGLIASAPSVDPA